MKYLGWPHLLPLRSCFRGCLSPHVGPAPSVAQNPGWEVGIGLVVCNLQCFGVGCPAAPLGSRIHPVGPDALGVGNGLSYRVEGFGAWGCCIVVGSPRGKCLV